MSSSNKKQPRVEVMDGDDPQADAQDPANGGQQQAFHAYCIATHHGTALGFDPRPMEAIQEEWLHKWKASAARLDRRARELMRAQREAERGFGPEPEDTGGTFVVGTEEVHGAPEPGEVLRLDGIPGTGGLGALRLLASDVRGIVHAPPAEVVEWLEAVGDHNAGIRAAYRREKCYEMFDELLDRECRKARAKHAPYNSSHEAYAVLLEEVEEFWEEVRKQAVARSPARMLHELVQVAAVARMAAHELGLPLSEALAESVIGEA